MSPPHTRSATRPLQPAMPGWVWAPSTTISVPPRPAWSGDHERSDKRVGLRGRQPAVMTAEAHAEAPALAPPDRLAIGRKDADVADPRLKARAGRAREQSLR